MEQLFQFTFPTAAAIFDFPPLLRLLTGQGTIRFLQWPVIKQDQILQAGIQLTF